MTPEEKPFFWKALYITVVIVLLVEIFIFYSLSQLFP